MCIRDRDKIVCLKHFIHQELGIVLLDTDLFTPFAAIAAQTGGDLHAGDIHCFDRVFSGFEDTGSEFFQEGIGIAIFAGASGDEQDIHTKNHLSGSGIRE